MGKVSEHSSDTKIYCNNTVPDKVDVIVIFCVFIIGLEYLLALMSQIPWQIHANLSCQSSGHDSTM